MTTELESPAPDTAQAGFGRRLAAAREQLGLSVADIAARLRLQPKQVAAIEAENLPALPAPFLRGFVRNYAREVHLDPEPLIADLNRRLQPPAAEPATAPVGGPPTTAAEQLPRRLALAAGVGVLLLFLVVGFVSNRGRPEVAPPPRAATAPAPTPEAVPTPVPVPAEPPAAASTAAEPTPAAGLPGQALVLRFREPSWVEVTQGEGRILLSQLNPAGTERVIDAKPPLKLVIGNASGVEVEFRGKRLDLKPLTSSENVARLTLN
ncbi:MAG: helix-turn-helix domain-containing protein [Burkholderiaceae bacterium]|nr:helix-turn-helix domain-containing protein [Burkholderiaceae bacterium]